MPLAPVPGVARIVVKGSIGNVATANIFHVKGPTGTSWSQPDLTSITTRVRLAYATRFAPLFTSSWAHSTTDGIDLTSDVGLVASDTSAFNGGKAGTSLPSNVAQCLTWKTAAHFRGGHCRTYLPPPSFNETTTPNTWLGTHVTAMNTAIAGFLADVNAVLGSISPALVMVSRIRQLNPIPGGPIAYPIGAGTFDTRVDSQRRRLGKDR